MRWYNSKVDRYSRSNPGKHGTKNNYVFAISDYHGAGWYVLIHNKQDDDNCYNSLWSDIWFPKIESAQEWCDIFGEFLKGKKLVTGDENILLGLGVTLKDGKYGRVCYQAIDELGEVTLRVDFMNGEPKYKVYTLADIVKVHR